MNQKKSQGMNPVVKVGLGCCALLGLLIVGFCVASMVWAQGLATIDGPKTAQRYSSTVGTGLPPSVTPRFSIDTSPAPIAASFAADAEPTKLTLIAVKMPPSQGQPMPEHEMAWKQIVGPFAPQMQQLGVSLMTAEAMLISDTGAAETKDLEIDGKTFKITVIPCKHTSGTELKRIYVKLKGDGSTTAGLFAVGSKDDFDNDTFEAALKGATPR